MVEQKITVPLGVNVQIPTEQTVKKYGLDEQGWLRILRDQGWVCPICKKPSSTGRYVVDHDHVRGFKKMAADEKRLYIRGITCWFCNHSYLGRGITVEKAKNVVAYLVAYAERKPKK
jgi:hypothetical protein